MKDAFYIFYRYRSGITVDWIHDVLDGKDGYGQRYDTEDEAGKAYSKLVGGCAFLDCDYDMFKLASNGNWYRMFAVYDKAKGHHIGSDERLVS